MDQPKAAQTSLRTPEAPYLRNLERASVADDDVSDLSVPGQQNAHLSVQIAGNCGQVTGQFGRHDLLRRNTSPEGAFQRSQLRRLDPKRIAVDVSDGRLPGRTQRFRRPLRPPSLDLIKSLCTTTYGAQSGF